MPTLTTTNIIELTGVLIGAIGLCAIFYQLRLSNRQQRLTFFTTYTQRFHELLKLAPAEVINLGANEPTQSVKITPEVVRFVRLYLDLCSEEFHLNEAGYIDKEVWQNWREGMDFILNKPELKHAIAHTLKSSSHNEEFRKFLSEFVK